MRFEIFRQNIVVTNGFARDTVASKKATVTRQKLTFVRLQKPPQKTLPMFAGLTGNLSKCSIYLCEYAGVRGLYKASIKQSEEIRALQLSYSALAAARHRTNKHFYHWH